MAEQGYAHQRDPRPCPTGVVPRQRLDTPAPPVGRVGALQAMAGNRAVCALLTGTQRVPSPAPVQRQPAPVGQQAPPVVAPLASLNDQIAIIGETQLPWAIWRDPRNVRMSADDVENELVKRKLNALSMLGDLHDERAVPTLIAVLDDTVYGVKRLQAANKAVLVREAAIALGKVGGAAAGARLTTMLGGKDPRDRGLAAESLAGSTGPQSATDLLARLQVESDPDVRFQIVVALGKTGAGLSDAQKAPIVSALIPIMEGTGDLTIAAVVALGRLGLRSATGPLLKKLRLWISLDDMTQVIARALGEIGDPAAVEMLAIVLTKHGSKGARAAAAAALGKIGGTKAAAALKGALRTEKDAAVKAAITNAMP